MGGLAGEVAVGSGGTAAEVVVVVTGEGVSTGPADESVVTGAATPQELGWLQQLADRHTVTDVAANASIAERTFRRRLATIYTTLNTGNLKNTITHARTQGWIT